jgi:hypothetical protein
MFKKGSFALANHPYYKTERHKKPPFGKPKRGFDVIDFVYAYWVQVADCLAANPPYSFHSSKN